MQGLTLTIAVIASGLIIFLPSIYGIIVYIAAFTWYPTYLSVPVGTVDFTVCRIAILAIFIKLLFTGSLNRFKFIWLDKLVIIYFAAELAAGSATTASLPAFLENYAGAFFDTVLPYFAVRMVLKTREQYLILLKAVWGLGAPLALAGCYQSVTGHNLAGAFQAYAAWGEETFIRNTEQRLGFYRATITFPHAIMYGLFFAMFGPICAGFLGNIKRNKMFYWAGLSLMSLGVFSSMSNGPLLAMLLSLLFIIFYRWRKYWKPIVIIIVIMCGVVETVSNRHVYEVLDRFTFSGRNAWYRSKLISIVLFEGGMSGNWLLGGRVNGEEWARQIDGTTRLDIVNHYIQILYRFGLMGLIPFFGVVIAAITKLAEAFRISLTSSDKWLVWCLSASLFGILGTMNTVMLFGPPVTIFYIMLAFCGSMPDIIRPKCFSPLKATAIKL